MKLHLGCGNRKIHGFINIDIDPKVNPDKCMKINSLTDDTIKNVELIYACHVLEHFDRHETKQVLKNWFNILNDNGTLRLSVPDFETICKLYLSNKYDMETFKGFLYGGQKNEWDYHKNCWDFESLKNLLIDVGFKKVEKYDWKKTEHFYIDDYSQSYLPHMDKLNGQLTSLNVQAIK